MIKIHAKTADSIRRFLFMYILLYHLRNYFCKPMHARFCLSSSAFLMLFILAKLCSDIFFVRFSIGTLQHFVQKLFETVAFRVGKKLIRRCLFEDFALRHKENPSADFSCKSHLVRDDNHRHSLVCNLFD